MNILIADDDRTSRLVLSATLKRLGHQVTSVADGAQALRTWQEGDFPLIISDWLMPDMDGLELCRRVRAQQSLHYTHLILLTSMDGKRNYLDAMQSGADDFITKPFDEQMLAVRISVAERVLKLHETLRAQAQRDPLMGIWNRRAILSRLDQELERAHRSGTQVGVIMADLDHFKRINDQHGHQAGDAVLVQAAQRMEAALRSYDAIGRYGGEEFLLVVPGCNAAAFGSLVERICAAVRAEPIEADGQSVQATVSLGAALSGLGERGEARALLAAADQALYAAKAAGRDRAVLDASALAA